MGRALRPHAGRRIRHPERRRAADRGRGGRGAGGGERRSITQAPTKDPEAYRLYLQGEEYRRRPGQIRENLESAERLYARALALDPAFALAHAAASAVHGELYWNGYDTSSRRLRLQQAEAEAALRLAPDLAWAHRAMGFARYTGHRDYRGALREFEIALRAAPNDGELWAQVGYVHRRLGDWAEVDSAYRRAIALDPRNGNLPCDLGGNTYLGLHRFAEAVRAYDRALALAPDLGFAAVAKGVTYVLWKGQLDSLRSALDSLPAGADLGQGATVLASRAFLLLWERKPGPLIALVRGGRGGSSEMDELFQPALYAGWAHRLQGDEPAARAAFASALETLATTPDAGQDGWRVHAQRGAALAALGRKAEALREVRWLRESAVCREDVFSAGPAAQDARAVILAQTGDADAAVGELEQALRDPARMATVHTLRLDPRYDPIRAHPRFQALLVKYADTEGRNP